MIVIPYCGRHSRYRSGMDGKWHPVSRSDMAMIADKVIITAKDNVCDHCETDMLRRPSTPRKEPLTPWEAKRKAEQIPLFQVPQDYE